jgi:hypothetical protein
MNIFIKDYMNWLEAKYSIREINSHYELNTPFLNHMNDYIQIYIKNNGKNGYILSDDGETISNLELLGIDLNNPNKKRALNTVLNGCGVILSKNNELTIQSNIQDFPKKKHNILQAILAVDDLHVLAQPKSESYFLDDVLHYLNKIDVRYSKNIVLQGKSSFQHKFDILIPPSIKYKERIVKIIPNPKKQNVVPILFAFEDTKSERDSEGILLLNDTHNEINSEVHQAISQYKIVELDWSKRQEDDFKNILVA